MKVKLLSKTAKVPTRGTQGSAGYDLYADECTFIVSNHNVSIETNVAVEIPEGHVGFVKPRSGLAFKHGVDTMAGVIDSDYRGTIRLLLTGHGRKPDVYVKRGDRIAQLIILPCITPELEVVDELSSDTERGENGFGSTGTN